MQKTITAIRFYSQDNMKESDTGRIKKTDQEQKIRTEICRIFLIAKWHLINYTSTTYSKYVVVAGVKLKILKANHNGCEVRREGDTVVVAGVKLKILKANHNSPFFLLKNLVVVVAGVKLKILKANHNSPESIDKSALLLLLV